MGEAFRATKKSWVMAANAIGRDALTAWSHWEDDRPRRAIEAAERWLDERLDVATCAGHARAAHACADALLEAVGAPPWQADAWRPQGHIARACALVAAAAAATTDAEAESLARQAAEENIARCFDQAGRQRARALVQSALVRFSTRAICGCYFGSEEGRTPGFCRRAPFAPDRMCPYCDDALYHRHCMSCGEPLPGPFDLTEVRCPTCPLDRDR